MFTTLTPSIVFLSEGKILLKSLVKSSLLFAEVQVVQDSLSYNQFTAQGKQLVTSLWAIRETESERYICPDKHHIYFPAILSNLF